MNKQQTTADTVSQPQYFVVVLAAGSGSRFKANSGHDTPKQFCFIGNKTVLEHSVTAVYKAVLPQECVVVHPLDDELAKSIDFSVPVSFVTGGKERMNSVLNALNYLKKIAKPNDFVMIHDGARPCITQNAIHDLIKATKMHAVGGILATPVSNTIKQVSPNQEIEKTIPRAQLWSAQTPQLFRYGMLLKALTDAVCNQLLVTDDASALELAGYRPLVVIGNQQNIKITYADDLALATYYLSK